MTTRRYHLPDGHPRQCQFPGCDWVRCSAKPSFCSKHLGQYRRGTIDAQGNNLIDPLLLPEDGIVDEIAVEIAALGMRPIRMTKRERIEATRRILAAGGDQSTVMQRIGVRHGAAWNLIYSARNNLAA